MASVKVLILRAAGINCDEETSFAWELAGARTELCHIRRLLDAPDRLREYQILTIPGGFSYGDDLSAGRVLAIRLERCLRDALHDFIAQGRLILGICNGFQVLVKAGLLPDSRPVPGPRTATIAHNQPAGFQARWVSLRAVSDHCAFADAGERYELPIAHGEGRVMFSTAEELERIRAADRIALEYDKANPNGSTADIAGLCDETGQVLGLMPHPERFVTGTQHPCWTSRPERQDGDGLAIFRRAVARFL